MEKKIGPALLIAGTCIGSGMIALPMVLAKLGLIPSLLLMAGMWFIMYYTSLINIELNLQANEGLSLGALGRLFSGKIAEFIGTGSLKLLSYALLAVFIYGGSSILKEMLFVHSTVHLELNTVATIFAGLAILLLLLPIKLLDYINRILFIGLLGIVGILIIGLIMEISWSNLPLFYNHSRDTSAWLALIPVVFTSFGFQVIFHTLTNYCKKNPKLLKQAFFWGSLIPAIVYIVWTASVLGVIYHHQPAVYERMADGKVEVGELIQALSSIAKGKSVQLLVWWISLLAIITSVLGVGLGLYQSIRTMLPNKFQGTWIGKILASMITILPAYLVVIYIPNAFIAALGFAGMILAIIAILLPSYLFWKIGASKQLYYRELKAKWLIVFSVLVGIGVMISELYHMV